MSGHTPLDASSGRVVASPEAAPLSKMLLDALVFDQRLLLTAGAGVVSLLVIYLAVRSSGALSGASKVRGRGGRGRRSGGGQQYRTITLAGTPDAGKTAIFTKLAYDQLTPTHSSLTTNASLLTLTEDGSSTATVKLIDVPGHARLRDKLQSALKETDDVVFVIDVAAIQKNGAEVTELLSKIMIGLAAKAIHYDADDDLPRLLILSHKSDTLGGRSSSTTTTTSSTAAAAVIDDKTASLSLDRTRSVLTKELTKLKSARSTLGGKIEGMSAVPMSADGGSSGMGGLFGKLFGRQQLASTTSDDQDSGDGTSSSVHDLEAAEAMIWGSGGRQENFDWAQLDGVQVEWAASALPGLKATVGPQATGDGEPDGLKSLREWLNRGT